MKKSLFLLALALVAVISLASCDIGEIHFRHEYEYIIYEQGHFKQYTCGCPAPDILEEHYDHNDDLLCDVCGYAMGRELELQTTETHHWWIPKSEGVAVIDIVYGYGEHENNDADMFCDICCYHLGAEIPDGNHFIRNQAGAQWLCEISAEDIAEIKIISGGGGPLPPVSFTYISSSTDKAVISSIFEEYYWLDSTPVSEERTQIADGGYVVVEFILNDGTVKRLNFINGEFYSDGKGNYFELMYLPVFRDGTNFVSRFGLETWYDHCQLHLIDGTPVCEIPVFELEFTELRDDIYLGAEAPTYYIEMNGVRLYFIRDCYFYIGEDRSTYYDLVGKNLEELIYDYTVLPD